jgi:hypothetical protein
MTRVTLFVSLAACLSAEESADRTPGLSDRPNDSLRNMLVINEENSHFFGSRKPEVMSLAGLHAFVDQYAGSAVTHLFLCPNAMRASFRIGVDVCDSIREER